MKYLYAFTLACLLLPAGCINLPEPELPEDGDAEGIAVDMEVTVADSIHVAASISAAGYRGKSADEAGFEVNNTEHAVPLPSNRTAFAYSIRATAGNRYSIRAYVRFGSRTFYSSYRQVRMPTGGSSASSIVDDCLSLSDGLYFYFKPLPTTKTYYFGAWAQSNLPDAGSNIVSDLIADGQKRDVGVSVAPYEGYAYDLTPNTAYTLCVLVVDNEGTRTLEKKTLTTKSDDYFQPRADISISRIASGAITYSVSMNSACASYVLIGFNNLSAAAVDFPDIHWAGNCYAQYKAASSVYDFDIPGDTWPDWSGASVIVSLGFTSSGVSSGVISKQFFSATKATAAYPAHPAAATPAQAQPKTPKSVDVAALKLESGTYKYSYKHK